MKQKVTTNLIQNLLPSEPDEFLGYKVEQVSHMWHAVYLCHPPYTYKEGVRTIWGYVKSNGDVYRPGYNRKPSRDKVCSILDLHKQNPYTLVYTKPSPLLKFL